MPLEELCVGGELGGDTSVDGGSTANSASYCRRSGCENRAQFGGIGETNIAVGELVAGTGVAVELCEEAVHAV